MGDALQQKETFMLLNLKALNRKLACAIVRPSSEKRSLLDYGRNISVDKEEEQRG